MDLYLNLIWKIAGDLKIENLTDLVLSAMGVHLMESRRRNVKYMYTQQSYPLNKKKLLMETN